MKSRCADNAGQLIATGALMRVVPQRRDVRIPSRDDGRASTPNNTTTSSCSSTKVWGWTTPHSTAMSAWRLLADELGTGARSRHRSLLWTGEAP
jgi:hypothetical protein